MTAFRNVHFSQHRTRHFERHWSIDFSDCVEIEQKSCHEIAEERLNIFLVAMCADSNELNLREIVQSGVGCNSAHLEMGFRVPPSSAELSIEKHILSPGFGAAIKFSQEKKEKAAFTKGSVRRSLPLGDLQMAGKRSKLFSHPSSKVPETARTDYSWQARATATGALIL